MNKSVVSKKNSAKKSAGIETISVVTNKYRFYPDYQSYSVDLSEQTAEPDQVLSMKDIYQKYVMTGQIAGLSSGVNPIVRDDISFDNPSLDRDYDDDLDILQESTDIKDRYVPRKKGAGKPAPSDKPQEPEPPKEPGDKEERSDDVEPDPKES